MPENDLTTAEKIIIDKLEEDYRKTMDIKSYQTAQQLLSITKTRRYKEKGVNLYYDYI